MMGEMMTGWLCSILISQGTLKDVHLPATSMDKALTEISRIYGVSMDATPTLKNKILVIEAHQVSEKDIRDQIALTFDATWEWKDTLWHLTQTAQQKKIEGQRNLAYRTKLVRRMIDNRLKVKTSTADFSPGFVENTLRQISNGGSGGFFSMSNAAYGQPDARFMTRFLKKFGVDRIAAVGPGKRQVFALRPNPMQLPMGIDLQDDLQQFQKERDLWKQIEKKFSGSKSTEPASEEDNFYRLGDVYFSVYCDLRGEYRMDLNGVTNDYKKSVFNVDTSAIEALFADIGEEDFNELTPKDFKLTQESADFRAFVTNGKKEIPKDRLSLQIDKFADPIERDPLAYGCSEALFYEAKRLNKNLVASVDDGYIPEMDPSIVSFYLLDKLKWLLSDFATQDSNWIRVRNQPLGDPNFSRIDLKQTIKRIQKAKEYSIEEQAMLAAKLPRIQGKNDIDSLLSAFAKTPKYFPNENDALRTLGLITQSEWQMATSERGIPFSQLSNLLQQHIYDCAFNDSRMNLHPINEAGGDTNQFAYMEPTLLAPLGIPSNAPLHISVVREDLIKRDDAEQDGEVQIGEFYTPTHWGQMKYFSDHPELSLGFPIDVSRKFGRWSIFDYRFTLTINPHCIWEATIHKVERTSDETFTISSFPSDIKKAFDEGYRSGALSKKGGGLDNLFPKSLQSLIRSH